MEIRIDDYKVRGMLINALNIVGNLSPIMHDIALMMRSTVEKNFEAEGRDELGRTHTWKPLAPSTQKSRARYKGEEHKAHPILEMTGRLKQSLHIAWGRDWAQVYSGVKYGVYHQTGTRKMPARPFMVMPEKDLHQIEEFIARQIEEAMKR